MSILQRKSVLVVCKCLSSIQVSATLQVRGSFGWCCASSNANFNRTSCLARGMAMLVGQLVHRFGPDWNILMFSFSTKKIKVPTGWILLTLWMSLRWMYTIQFDKWCCFNPVHTLWVNCLRFKEEFHNVCAQATRLIVKPWPDYHTVRAKYKDKNSTALGSVSMCVHCPSSDYVTLSLSH